MDRGHTENAPEIIEEEKFSREQENKNYKTIMDDIIRQLKSGKLHPGDRLPPERQWADEIGISRSALREALRALEIIGLVTSRQGGGNFVSRNYSMAMFQPMNISYWLSNGNAYDIHEFRSSLEIAAAGLAAEHAEEKDVEELRDIYGQMKKESDIVRSSRLDRKLHGKIADMSGNCLIRDSLLSAGALIDDIIYGLRLVIFEKKEDAETLADQHRRIVDAVAAHDPEKARKEMTEHMNFVKQFIRLLK